MPITIAPYEVHLVEIVGGKGESEKVQKAAVKLYQDLVQAGVEVLFDDRNESPGVKFNDADLIGIPLRLTVGSRALKEGGIEVKIRHETEKKIIPVDEVVQKVKEIIQEMYTEVEQNLETVDFIS